MCQKGSQLGSSSVSTVFSYVIGTPSNVVCFTTSCKRLANI